MRKPRTGRAKRRAEVAHNDKTTALVQRCAQAGAGHTPISKAIIRGAVELKSRGMITAHEYAAAVRAAKAIRDAAAPAGPT